MNPTRQIQIIGAPTDLGASRRGVDMGTSALRIAGLGAKLSQLGYKVHDIGNLPSPIPEIVHEGDSKLKHFKEIFDLCLLLKNKSIEALENNSIPLALGGDHSIAIGSVAAVMQHYHSKNSKIGLLWFDAHGDINTPETSPSGNIHGMPVAHLFGLGDSRFLNLISEGKFDFLKNSPLSRHNTVLFGIRDLDHGERMILRDLNIRTYTMSEIDERGTPACLKEALDIVNKDTCGFHLSLDADWLDPEVAPGVGTRVPGGANYREAHLAMEMCAKSNRILSMDLVEVNPILDQSNKTAELMVELTLSAFGKTIL
jgi:arginase